MQNSVTTEPIGEESLREQVSMAVDEWLALPAESTDTDPLEYWREQLSAKTVPRAVKFLAPLARKYLAAPGANGTVERLWSDGRRIFSYCRHALSGTRFNQLLRLKHNLEALGSWPPSELVLP